MSNTDTQELVDALQFVPESAAYDRRGWIAIGMAIHSVLPEQEGLELWHDWSTRTLSRYHGRKYGERTPELIDDMWRGFRQKSGGIKAGTIFKFARDNGWRSDKQHADGNGHHRPQPQPAQRQHEPQPRREKNYFWADQITAKKNFSALPEASEDPEVCDFLEADYGLERAMLPDTWRVFTHPKHGKGIVYQVSDLNGRASYKFKSLKRDPQKKKRTTVVLFYVSDDDYAPAYYHEFKNQPLVLTGGEEKAWLLHTHGYEVISMPSESAISAPWIRFIAERDYPGIILAGDNDKKGQEFNENAKKALSAAGYSRFLIKTVTWPKDAPEGYDINNAHLEEFDIYQIIENATPAFESLTILSYQQIVAHKPDPNRRLIHDNLLAKGQIMGLMGAPGIGKSRLTMWMAICCIKGFAWCGLETFAQGTRWLFIQNENATDRLHTDIGGATRIMRANGSDRDLHDKIFIHAPEQPIDMACSFAIDGTVDRFRDLVKMIDPDVVVLDPLISYFKGDNENDSNQMHDTVSTFRSIIHARRKDVAGIIVHHAATGKAALAEGLGWNRIGFGRGSKALPAALRSVVNVAPGSTEEKPPVLVWCGKNSNGIHFNKRAVRLTDDMKYVVDDNFDWASLEDELHGRRRPGRKEQAEMDELSIIHRLPPNGTEISQNELISEVRDELAIARNTVVKKINALVDRKLITQRKDESGGPNGRFYVRLNTKEYGKRIKIDDDVEQEDFASPF